jgi:polyhydroxyalkanoate synthesis repressor PhaR
MRHHDSMEGSGTGQAPRLIRRYGNRKLYDLETGRYVTLEDIARLVASGMDVEVVDRPTGQDLTNLTLAQVLLDGVKQGASRIPRPVLTRLIRLAAAPTPAWADWPDPREVAGRARQEAERIVGRLLGRGQLSLDEAVALRRDLGQLVHRRVAEAQAGVESGLRALAGRAQGPAGRSLEALRGGLRSLKAIVEDPGSAPLPRSGVPAGRTVHRPRRSSTRRR